MFDILNINNSLVSYLQNKLIIKKMEYYNVLGMSGTAQQFLNLFYIIIGIFGFLGISIFIMDRRNKN